MAKYQHIARLLESRIQHGDYLLKEVPSERDLAVEANVSPMTVRKAISHLMRKGLLVRQANKRLAVNRGKASGRGQLQIALLVPAYPNPYVDQWHLWLEEMASDRNYLVRVIGYCHWDDAVIRDTLEGFDGIFFLPLCDEVPESLVSMIKQSGRPVVMLGQDLSREGIPSLRLTSPEMIRRLLDYVGAMGHDRVDCLNTQPLEQVGRHRIEQWQLWVAAHGKEGRLINEEVKLFKSAVRQAYETVVRLIRGGELKATAIFCTTSGAAMGAMRAIYECGLVVGKDISVCSSEDGADHAPYLTPSLTCLKDRDPKPYLSLCVDWMTRGGKDWVGPLLVQPADAIVFEGESVGRRGA